MVRGRRPLVTLAVYREIRAKRRAGASVKALALDHGYSYHGMAKLLRRGVARYEAPR